MSWIAGVDRSVRDLCVREDRPVLIAVDGRSGVGKTTLASELAGRHGGASIPGDDFYSGGSDELWLSLTPAERVARVIDWRRLLTEVLDPLLTSRPVTWKPFDFETGHGLSPHAASQGPVPVIVLDGTYSARPELADLVDLSVLVTLDDEQRRAGLLEREGEMFMTRWHRIWDQAEEYYFSAIRPPASFDVIARRS